MAVTTKTILTKEQRARIEAMGSIAGYVRDIKFMSGVRADPRDLIKLSEYILKGVPEEQPKPVQIT